MYIFIKANRYPEMQPDTEPISLIVSIECFLIKENTFFENKRNAKFMIIFVPLQESYVNRVSCSAQCRKSVLFKHNPRKDQHKNKY